MISNAAKFKCTQEGLYAAATHCCDLLTAYLADFSHFSPWYSADYISNLRQAVAAAQARPGEDSRAGRKKAVRGHLKQAKAVAMQQWQQLKACIEKAWPDTTTQKAKLSEAGSHIYLQVNSKGQWGLVHKLMSTGALFIAGNQANLLRNHNMPSTFEASFSTAASNFAAQHNTYSSTSSTNEILSDARRKANNEVYNQVIQVCKDGHRIYKGNAMLQKQFAFSQMLRTAGYGGTAGIRITVVQGAHNLPVANATATAPSTTSGQPYTATTNTQGILKINRMTAGEHTLTITAPGYHPLQVTVTLHPRVKSRFKLTMIAEVVERAA